MPIDVRIVPIEGKLLRRVSSDVCCCCNFLLSGAGHGLIEIGSLVVGVEMRKPRTKLYQIRNQE